MEILGIDVGGSGIKATVVDSENGTFVAERHRIETPQPSKPEAVINVIEKLIEHFEWNGPIGCTFPAIVKQGIAYSAANIDQAWIGTNVARLIADRCSCQVEVINDADAAGLAEMKFGQGRAQAGTVLMLTIGTGIGSALFYNGVLVPNTELGHLEIRGKIGEARASDRVRSEKDLSWKKWGKRLNEYLQHVEFLFSPNLIVLGGGVSKKFDKFSEYLDLKSEIVPAELRNDAGIIGAAMAAVDKIDIR